jgi:putative hemolysin
MPATLDVVRSPFLSGYQPSRSSLANQQLRQGPYLARFASTDSDLLAALRLRFEVFNLELNEGLDDARQTGYDIDKFDACCDHLIVEHTPTGRIAGTYRLQTGTAARSSAGYYSEREFNFLPYEHLRTEIIELGRACIHRDHRSTDVLYLLWRGIAQYALAHGARYLIGCSSLSSQDFSRGSTVYRDLWDFIVPSELRTVPQNGYAMPLVAPEPGAKIPKLLQTYLAIGARICGPPAIDREFKTIDFLTLLDLQALHPRIRARFLERD